MLPLFIIIIANTDRRIKHLESRIYYYSTGTNSCDDVTAHDLCTCTWVAVSLYVYLSTFRTLDISDISCYAKHVVCIVEIVRSTILYELGYM